MIDVHQRLSLPSGTSANYYSLSQLESASSKSSSVAFRASWSNGEPLPCSVPSTQPSVRLHRPFRGEFNGVD
jgi:hypothetical protein